MSFVFRPPARFLLSCFCLTALLNAMGAISPQRKLNQGGPDPERIPFGEELTLQTLVPGAYDLRVTITDSIARTSVTQTIGFVVL